LNGLTWLGHSTVVIDLEGTRVITDPVLRGRIWHLRRDAVVAPAAVGHLDAILVSHTHYDHLDLGSLDRLDRNLPVVVPRPTLKSSVLILAIALAAGRSIVAQEGQVGDGSSNGLRQLRAVRAAGTIALDGTLDEPAWAVAPPQDHARRRGC